MGVAVRMTQHRRSALDRLLETLSWDGATIRKYREGGAGQENVLTTEVLSALDFLPRSFLGAVLAAAHGDQAVLDAIAAEVEDAEIVVLGDDIFLKPSGKSHGERMTLQPDAVIETSATFVLVEAKRARQPAAFGDDQLARSLAVAVAQAGERRPLLLLVMGAAPPIKLRGSARRVGIEESIAEHLPRVCEASDFELDATKMLAAVSETVAWITWDEVREVTDRHLRRFESASAEVQSSIARLVGSIASAVERHR